MEVTSLNSYELPDLQVEKVTWANDRCAFQTGVQLLDAVAAHRALAVASLEFRCNKTVRESHRDIGSHQEQQYRKQFAHLIQSNA